MSPTDLHFALLRPPVLHILRAAGFQSARPAAVDSVVDLAARYLTLLASKTAIYAQSNHGGPEPELEDVRMALEAVGALRPEHGTLENQFDDDDDTRGVDAFTAWAQGDRNREITRVAGLTGTGNEAVDLEGAREDYLTMLKKKHSKTGEESRFQGTVLGKPAQEKPTRIEGNASDSIRAWEDRLRQTRAAASTPLSHAMSSPSGMTSPLSEV